MWLPTCFSLPIAFLIIYVGCFADGAFNQAFVPVMTEYKAKGIRSAVRELLAQPGTLGLVITIVTIIGVLGSTVISALFGWGWFMAWWHNEPGGG